MVSLIKYLYIRKSVQITRNLLAYTLLARAKYCMRDDQCYGHAVNIIDKIIIFHSTIFLKA